MKVHHKKPSVVRGSALAITLLSCAILGTLVGSYLYLGATQQLTVTRSQSWNQALVVAEGGVDEAMALLNSGVQAPSFAVFPWTSAGGGVFNNDTNRPACKFGTSYYEVSITNGVVGGNPVIISKGYVPGPIGSPVLMRTVRVEAKPRKTFPVKGPMIVEQTFNANGYNTGTDSFDSSLGAYGTNNISTNGDVVSLTTNANSIIIGNGKINGTVRTPVGGIQGVTATIGSNGKVGDAAWIASSSTGFESGHFQANFTLSDFPDATLPNVSAWFTPLAGTAPDGFDYDNLLPSGNYQIADLTGSVYVGQSNTVLYVTSSINIGSGGGGHGGHGNPAPAEIHIAPGGSLTIYMAGATTAIAGNGVANDTLQAKNFQYYGLPSNTSINITGNGSFFGTIYAPEADFTLKGSGNNSTDDFTGASITKTTKMTGNFNFHYDEALSQLTTLAGYDAFSWAEN
jgi:hypothetical protein